MNNFDFLPQNIQLNHLLDIESLSKDNILGLIENANFIMKNGYHLSASLDILKSKTVAHLFFEASTRTQASFDLAAKRLGATVLNLDVKQSAKKKGESLLDTLKTLEAMHINCFVIRHPENSTPLYLSENAASNTHIINAGDGVHAHPSQALLDLMTIKNHKSDIENLSIAVVGDVKHSRVANSLITILQKVGVKNISIVGPDYFLDNKPSLKTTSNLKEGLEDADVVYLLRIQNERLSKDLNIDTKTYHDTYGLTTKTLAYAKPDAILMHPGPFNRDVEIESALAYSDQSVILEQVENGVPMRMAILCALYNQ